ncbi:MAG: metallophosphoesterase [Pseudomonadales bacterium]|jgi:serine/threonine protein phosphatase 1|nr:metallophosphoesterase [Gammaproteobacteria bacterium]MBP6050829.1 metallophosphoesterase [Pseudomonadales bacterium]MBK6584383.1 metallophosphoesterase [Gammaproteobacteria bacterium]MBK7168377.1 metallophosphoesterase [Gammaproteobacteria bacterium]MBK7520842.1 metallophosphoesterase [Gammaproteobacteria bacterium]
MTPFHSNVPPNRFGRDFIIGDLHGMVSALEAALEARQFIPGRDRLFSVGDLVDRGPASVAAVELIRNKWFHAVRGNHEDMLLRAVAGEEPRISTLWRENGGAWGMRGEDANAAARAAAALCATLPHAITLHHKSGRRFGICHAQCPVADWNDIERALNDPELRRETLWARERIRRDNAQPVRNIDLTIHGHTVVKTPLRSANALFIETGAYLPDGYLSLLCLDDLARDAAPIARR